MDEDITDVVVIPNNTFQSGRSKQGKFTAGNKFGVGSTVKYNPQELASGCQNYFEWIHENPFFKTDVIRSGNNAGQILYIPVQRPMTLSGLLVYLGIVIKTWNDYSERNRHKDICAFVREIIDQNQLEGAMVGVFNPAITARRLGLVDKTEVKDTTEKLEGIQIEEI